jgi:hypothetical protein
LLIMAGSVDGRMEGDIEPVETARKSNSAVDHEERRVTLEEKDAMLERAAKTIERSKCLREESEQGLIATRRLLERLRWRAEGKSRSRFHRRKAGHELLKKSL